MNTDEPIDVLLQYRTWAGREIVAQDTSIIDLIGGNRDDPQRCRISTRIDPNLRLSGAPSRQTPPERNSLHNLVILIHEGAFAPGFWDWKHIVLEDDPVTRYGEFLGPWEKQKPTIEKRPSGEPPFQPSSGGSQHSVFEEVGREKEPQSDWTNEKNHRRCELVDKEIDGTLSPAEKAELEVLQAEMLAYRRKVAPLPLSDLRELHQELLQKFHEQSE